MTTDIRESGASTAYGDWSCRCGISYRFVVVDGERVCWPKNGHESFRVEPAETCIGCGWEIRDPTLTQH